MNIKSYIARLWWCGIICMVPLLMAGCGEETEATPDNPLVRNEAPEWDFTPNRNNYQTMTLIATLPGEMASDACEDDEMAVVAGEEVVGVAERVDTGHGVVYFALIAMPSDDAPRTLRVFYYSAFWQHIFKTDAIGEFASDGMIGSMSAPLVLHLNP